MECQTGDTGRVLEGTREFPGIREPPAALPGDPHSLFFRRFHGKSRFFSLQDVHELLKDYELKYCFVDKYKGTGEGRLRNSGIWLPLGNGERPWMLSQLPRDAFPSQAPFFQGSFPFLSPLFPVILPFSKPLFSRDYSLFETPFFQEFFPFLSPLFSSDPPLFQTPFFEELFPFPTPFFQESSPFSKPPFSRNPFPFPNPFF